MRVASKAHDGQTAVVSYCLVLTFLTVGNVDGAAIHSQCCFVQGFGQGRMGENHHAACWLRVQDCLAEAKKGNTETANIEKTEVDSHE